MDIYTLYKISEGKEWLLVCKRENTLRKAGGLIDGSCTLATYYKC